MSERRRDPRLEEENAVCVKVLKAPEAPSLEGQTFFCTTADLSEHGLRFCIPMSVPVGALLELSVGFVVPGRAFTHRGRVVWIGDDEENGRTAVGIEFTDVQDDQHAAWKNILESKIGGWKK